MFYFELNELTPSEKKRLLTRPHLYGHFGIGDVQLFARAFGHVPVPWPWSPARIYKGRLIEPRPEAVADVRMMDWLKDRYQDILWHLLPTDRGTDWYYSHAALVPCRSELKMVRRELATIMEQRASLVELLEKQQDVADRLGYCGLQADEGFYWLIAFSDDLAGRLEEFVAQCERFRKVIAADFDA